MPDVVDVIMQDHREVERLFEVLQREPEKRAATVPVLVTLLTAHSRAEEAEVYPAAREEAGAEDLVAHSQQEHAEADRLLQRLATCDPATSEFDAILEDLVDAVTHHVEEEESDVLPAMTEGLSDDRRSELADAFLVSRAQHLGETPQDITKAERQVQAQNAGLTGSSSMTKDEIAQELSEQAE